MSGIPGSNLLNSALGVIASQSVDYYKFASRATNTIGMEVSTYDSPIVIFGSFQPINSAMYEEYGLDLSRTYANFYSSNNIISVDRDVSGDYLIFQGDKYQCESNTKWFGIDGWNAVLVVKTI
jgi:hypothetical protein